VGTRIGAEVDEAKLRGGYYTPAPIGEFLSAWAIRSRNAQVLEPSAGDGEIVVAASRHLGRNGHVTAVELLPTEAEKLRQRVPRGTSVVGGDVFAWYARERLEGHFDSVVGNPPFIRYQSFPEEHRRQAFGLMEKEGLHPTRLTNAWVPFVVLATTALRQGGRLALVLPAELLQVGYAGELREYLARKYVNLNIVTFRHLLFPGIQQETVLLLGDRGDSQQAAISFAELDSLDDLPSLQSDERAHARVDLDHAREKWTQYYLTPKELGLVRELEVDRSLTTLGAIASVDVGIVTGRNEFFVLSQQEAVERGVIDKCVPLVGRSIQLPGLKLAGADWRALAKKDGKCYLLQLGDVSRKELPLKAASYVRWAEQRGMHEGYKCRIRLPRWWNVPSVWAPDAFLLRQIHDGPRIIHNAAGVTCTDTIHRVRMNDGISAASLAAASMNSLTYAFAEIRGRSYGGGVLELEPTEAEGLPFPRPHHELPLKELDIIARRKSTEQVLAEVDRLVLEPTGLSRSDTMVLRGVWRRLVQRRMSRKRRPASYNSPGAS
jgi:adenine-specific DNA-methyltransferase